MIVTCMCFSVFLSLYRGHLWGLPSQHPFPPSLVVSVLSFLWGTIPPPLAIPVVRLERSLFQLQDYPCDPAWPIKVPPSLDSVIDLGAVP